MVTATQDPVLSLYMDGYLNKIMDKKPLLKREWEPEDFCQELSIAYLRKVSSEKRQEMSKEHQNSLVKRMAIQLSQDKLRQLQRKKRDCRRILNNFEGDFSSKNPDVLDTLCNNESIHILRKHFKDEMWSVFCMRNDGLDWNQIAKLMNHEKPDSLRMKLSRVVKAISALLNKE